MSDGELARMNTSLFELFKIGIGPSSSHTVGPMRAANHFVAELKAMPERAHIRRLVVDLYGSLALTGIGHGTDRAVIFGLMGEAPDTIDTQTVDQTLATVREKQELRICGEDAVPFREETDLRFHREQMYPEAGHATHPNGLRFTALGDRGEVLLTRVFYSVGGGFILTADEFANASQAKKRDVPFPFSSADELLAMADASGMSIADVVLANEVALLTDATITYRIDRIFKVRDSLGQAESNSAKAQIRSHEAIGNAQGPEARIKAAILVLWQVMEQSIERGIATEGTLPGGLNVRRRAPGLSRRLAQMDAEGKQRDPLAPLDAVTLAAMAVNEENAAGGRVVTAPTNGAAGVVPAIAHYFLNHTSPGLTDAERTAGLLRYFLERGGDRHLVQGERIDLRRGGWVPGRGGRRVLDGRRRACGGAYASAGSRVECGGTCGPDQRDECPD